MEALQLAQMLADLNDLQAAQDQGAAKALVAANKNLERAVGSKDVPTPTSQPQSKGAGTPAVDSRTATPAGRFDKLGRRIFSPPMSRTNSFTPSTSSMPGTPRKEDVRDARPSGTCAFLTDTDMFNQIDGDIDRASTLLSLYEIRAKLKEQDNSSLMKAREKINALAAKQAQLAKQHQQSQLQPKLPTSQPTSQPKDTRR
ncbi:chromatin modification- protein eaf6 [Pestalotiopsis sp. IQ-011]